MYLWKFPRGYAKIVFTASRPEAFVNELLKNGVSLHNVRRISICEASAIVRFDSLDALRETADSFGVDLGIIKTGGAAVMARALLARTALLIGIAAAIALMAVLSKRILFVSVDGAGRELTAAVRHMLETELMLLGTPAAEVDYELIRSSIERLDPELKFVRVETDGVVLSVDLFESLNAAKARELAPSSIYADKDCVIIKLFAFEGKALVHAGDAVRKGQLLVSGDAAIEGVETVNAVHSDAEIIGEVARSFEICVEPFASAPVLGKNEAPVCAVKLFGFEFVSETLFADRRIGLEYTSPLDAAFLPVFVSCGRAKELVIGQRALTRDEMTEEAYSRLNAAIDSALPEDAVIVSKTSEIALRDDGALILTAAVHTYEKIGYTRYL